jgi:hypothetical protein
VRLTGTGYTMPLVVTLDFGRVFRGDSVRRAVYLDDMLQDGHRWMYSGRLDPPFELITLSGPINVPREDTVAYVFQFKPWRLGYFTDTLRIIRIGVTFPNFGPPFDTLTVYLQGESAGFSVDARLDFGPMLIGDSAVKERTVLVPPEPRFDLADPPGLPKAPFALTYFRYPDPRPPDSARIGVSFAPWVAGKANDSVFFVRFDQNAQERDSIRIRFEGSGATMPAADTLTFDPVRKGDDLTQDLVIRHPVPYVHRKFRYSLMPAAQGPITAVISSPTVPSNDVSISLRFRVRVVDEFLSRGYRFVLYRLAEQATSERQAIDSTVIIVNIRMVPRPVTFTMHWKDRSLNHALGDTARLELQIVTTDPIDVPIVVNDFNATITYNPTVFVPLVGDNQKRLVDDDMVRLRISGLAEELIVTETPVTVATVRGIVALGDAGTSDVRATSASITYQMNGTKPLTSDTARLFVTNIWHYDNGKARYVNSLMGSLSMKVDPNPVTESATLTIENVPEGKGRLQIVDAVGRVVDDLTVDVRNGKTSWIIVKGSGYPLSLMPGTYYARLFVDGSNNETINGVARLIIVQ